MVGDASSVLDGEQEYINHAYRCLEAMRARVERALAQARRDAKSTDASDFAQIEAILAQRLRAVADSRSALTFGRTDEGAERYYIGRRHVEDGRGDPVVVDWRAPVAAPFYRATWADPLGLDRRRRFALDGRQLAGFFDEDFADPDSAGLGGGGIPDPLLAELDRARTGELRDIVATIQAEQDVVIRAPLHELIVVQGGPGTGKTAVGLHRAAFLLFNHRDEMERRKLLIVGPNRTFLAYIGQVLPSLGETAAVQSTIEQLVARAYPVRATDAPAVAALKGDPRMALVVAALVRSRINPPRPTDPDSEVMTGFGLACLPSAAVGSLVDAALARNLPTNQARDGLRTQLVALAWRTRLERGGARQEQQFEFSDDLRTRPEFRRLLDRWWPATGAASLVRSLLGSPGVRNASARGFLTDAESRTLQRRPARKVKDERWTRADLGLLDEVDALTNAEHPLFGHVVVDEAQDLSAMELRMVARRANGRSLTVLGDLAQSTGVGSGGSWERAMESLTYGRPDSAHRIVELELGYRVPAPILDYANRLLPIAAPGLRASRSVRTAGEPPRLVPVAADQLFSVTAEHVIVLLRDHVSVGVLADDEALDAIATALSARAVPFCDARGNVGIAEGVTLIEARLAKGLEFDAVVVVEPAAVVAAAAGQGVRVLYVALTRAVQRVTIVHSQPLPEVLRTPARANPLG